jgi:hypothetical protein
MKFILNLDRAIPPCKSDESCSHHATGIPTVKGIDLVVGLKLEETILIYNFHL